jgi:hypothetical protein
MRYVCSSVVAMIPCKINTSLFLLLTALSLSYSSYSQEKTVIKGKLTDSHNGNPIQLASVFIKGTSTGTLTNSEGKYYLETTLKTGPITFSFIGYKTETREFQPGKEQVIDVTMAVSSITLDEVVVRPERRSYRNKNNPAVELIDKVVAGKKMNRPESFNYLEYKTYEKIQFALSNVTETFRSRNAFSKFSFIFENIDTTRRIGNDILPLFIKETVSSHYFRKEPQATKDIIQAEKSIKMEEYLNNKGASAYLNHLYQDINIYDNEILFLTNKFLSPIAGTAPLFYRYYIIDTVPVADSKCIKLFFEPRNRSDFLFHGNLYITMDSSYAVRKIDIGINKAINIDWVQDISIIQDFEKVDGKAWLLSNEEISIDFGIVKNMMGLYGQRTTAYKDYKLNQPISDRIFRGPVTVERIDRRSDQDGYWESNRYVPLTRSESQIYTTIDSLRQIPDFRRKMDAVTMLVSGYLDAGKTEIGPIGSFYSYNNVEGSRFKFSGRTNTDFSRKVTIDAFAAYGTGDRTMKYGGGITYSLTPRTIYQFPVKSLKLSYLKDVRIPGEEFQFTQADNILFSLKRGVDDKRFLNNTIRAEWLDEFENHFSILTGYSFTRQSASGNLYFMAGNNEIPGVSISHLNISEIYLHLRYAPNETFYQGKQYRSIYPNKYPVIQLKAAGGNGTIGNDFDYLRLQFNLSRRFYVSLFGYTDVTFEAGKIFGQVPYPLLFEHRANQTYSYQQNGYNLMNFLEFVSDRYVSLNVDHCFNGYILNKVPLIKKLKLRELVTCKVVYGKLYDRNDPSYTSTLLQFPSDALGVPLTYTLNHTPYIEGSIGLSNIFRIFRVDLIRRFTYLENPNVSKLGVRLQIKLDI